MRGRVVCFIPCCKTKEPQQFIGSEDSPAWFTSRVSKRLRAATEAGSFDIETNSPRSPALELYQGHFYQALSGGRSALRADLEAGHLITPIISAGYGLLDPREPIHEYDEEMRGKTATFWRDQDLVGLIAEALLDYRPSRVFGFFTGSSELGGSSSNYRYFYTEGVRKALANGLKVSVAGCFHWREGNYGTPRNPRWSRPHLT